jgi:hypothetical protein
MLVSSEISAAAVAETWLSAFRSMHFDRSREPKIDPSRKLYMS